MPMVFPKKTDTPSEPKKGPQVLDDGRVRGCAIARGPEKVEVDGREVIVTVQVVQPAATGKQFKGTQLQKLARSALSRPGGVKEVLGGLIKVTAREV
jgi:hypothetical protein